MNFIDLFYLDVSGIRVRAFVNRAVHANSYPAEGGRGGRRGGREARLAARARVAAEADAAQRRRRGGRARRRLVHLAAPAPVAVQRAAVVLAARARELARAAAARRAALQHARARPARQRARRGLATPCARRRAFDLASGYDALAPLLPTVVESYSRYQNSKSKSLPILLINFVLYFGEKIVNDTYLHFF